MRSTVQIIFAFLLLAFLPPVSAAEDSGRLKAVATIFPLFDFTREVGGDKVEVSMLLPPGVEAHSFEPRPQDIIRLGNADVILWAGDCMEPWMDEILAGLQARPREIVDASKAADLLSCEGEDHEGHTGDEKKAHVCSDKTCGHSHHGGIDPHYWLDFTNCRKIVSQIESALSKKSSKDAEYFKSRAENYAKRLDELDRKFSDTLGKCKGATIFYGGHFAFAYLAKRYGLSHKSPYKGFAPDAEPSPKDIAEMIKNMRQSGAKYIFHEELIDPRVAKALAEETGAQLLLLHGAHNISAKELQDGTTFISIMDANLERLRTGLAASR